MAKKPISKPIKGELIVGNAGSAKNSMIYNEQQAMLQQLVMNMATLRSRVLSMITDPRRDIDSEAGYPEHIDLYLYKRYFKREGVAKRVVTFEPEECWQRLPEINENDDDDETPWETEVKNLIKTHNFFHYCKRVDVLSGIGHYGVLFVGLDDGMNLDEPADGINEFGEMIGSGNMDRAITFLRPLDETQAQIASIETNDRNPRYGRPTFYNLTLSDPDDNEDQLPANYSTHRVHWSRVVHIADNRQSSEISGTPRMEDCFNYLYNLKKIYGASPEALWIGGFPQYSFEVNPDIAAEVEMDPDEVREEFMRFSNSMQRYLATQGVTAKVLSPTVGDPKEHVIAQLQAICITKGYPLRIFMGSEQAQLASEQDKKNWRERVNERQTNYLTPWVIRPLIMRLMGLGVLPYIEEFDILWPDPSAPSRQEKSAIALSETQALVAYANSPAPDVVPEPYFLTQVMGWEDEVVQKMLASAVKRVDDMSDYDTPLRAREEMDREHESELAKEQFGHDLKKGDQQIKGKLAVEKAKPKKPPTRNSKKKPTIKKKEVTSNEYPELYVNPTSHKFASTQLDIAFESPIGLARPLIDEADLTTDGFEDHPHVTIRYGVLTDDVEALRQHVEGFGPVRVGIQKFGYFHKKKDNCDVVVLLCSGSKLHGLRSLVESSVPCAESDYPTYRPHITVAYVRAGLGQMYSEKLNKLVLPTVSEALTFETLTFSTKDRQKYAIRLVGLLGNYDPDQPRDEDGKWTDGGGGGLENFSLKNKERGSHVTELPNGVRVTVHPNFLNEYNQQSGRKLTPKDLADLVGASEFPDAEVSIFPMGETDGSDGPALQIRTSHPLFTTDRFLMKDSILNEDFHVVKEAQGKGLGTRVLHAQVQAAARLGYKELTVMAGRGPEANGYYTWPRLGYDTRLGSTSIDTGKAYREWQQKFPGTIMVSDLMKTQEGRDWWKKNGTSAYMKFDLSKGSLSRKVLDAYVEATKKE